MIDFIRKERSVIYTNTNERTEIYRSDTEAIIFDPECSDLDNKINLHIHLLSDEVPVEGDWCYYEKEKDIIVFDEYFMGEIDLCSKVIATTYQELMFNLPKISSKSIEEICELDLNKVNVIVDRAHNLERVSMIYISKTGSAVFKQIGVECDTKTLLGKIGLHGKYPSFFTKDEGILVLYRGTSRVYGTKVSTYLRYFNLDKEDSVEMANDVQKNTLKSLNLSDQLKMINYKETLRLDQYGNVMTRVIKGLSLSDVNLMKKDLIELGYTITKK